MKGLIRKFKDLTGYKLADIARITGVTRQAVSLMFGNRSLVYRTSCAFLLNGMIDKKVEELNYHINQLQKLKEEVTIFALTNTKQELREAKFVSGGFKEVDNAILFQPGTIIDVEGEI